MSAIGLRLSLHNDAREYVAASRRGRGLLAVAGRPWVDVQIARYVAEVADREGQPRETLRGVHRAAAREVRRGVAWWVIPLAEILLRLLWAWLKRRWDDRSGRFDENGPDRGTRPRKLIARRLGNAGPRVLLAWLLLTASCWGQAASYNELMGLGSHSADANLEGWWPMLSDYADDSGNANDLTAIGTPTSTTGPNSFATGGYTLGGETDGDSFTQPDIALSTAATFLCRANASSAASGTDEEYAGIIGVSAGLSTTPSLVLRRQTDNTLAIRSGASTVATTASTFSENAWHTFGMVWEFGGSATADIYLDGSIAVDDTGGPSTISGADVYIGKDKYYERQFLGDVSESAVFSRQLTGPEMAQWHAGPEPINTVAPVASGTPTQGDLLSCTSGTWGLDAPWSIGSNGTISYSYQWTRSTDGSGTGEADISGATSSSYTPQAADVGYYLRCRVRGANSGGYDAAADTGSNFLGPVTGLRRWYKLDETSGTTCSDSSSQNDVANYYGGPTLNATGPGGDWTAAVVFDGSTQYISDIYGGSNIWPGSPTTATVAARFQCDAPGSTTAEQIIFEGQSGSAGPVLYVYGNQLYGGSAVSGTLHYVTATLNDTGWHDAVMVCNGTALSLYLDGSLASSTTMGATFTVAASSSGIACSNTTCTHLGTDYTAAIKKFNGAICDVRCYDVAQDSTWVAAYNAEAPTSGGGAPAWVPQAIIVGQTYWDAWRARSPAAVATTSALMWFLQRGAL